MDGATQSRIMTGAEIVLKALEDQGVNTVFGYPGGAVLPIYDALHQQSKIRHILVRHEQGAGHMAEGYARSTGKCGVAIATSGPGATNLVTPVTDAVMDSIPIVAITGQVPTHLIGSDAFQECDTVGVTRACCKHNYLVRNVADLARTLHQAFHVAQAGRPGPVVVDIPKDVQFASGLYVEPENVEPHRTYRPRTMPEHGRISQAAALLSRARRPVFYIGGGIINSGDRAQNALLKLAQQGNFPVTSTLMGLGAFPASSELFLGMLGMHGSYEANNAMHDCDLMICAGARFDDRVTGRLDAFSPSSKKIHIDIDPSSINKNVRVDIPIVADCGHALESLLQAWNNSPDLSQWWKQINQWRQLKCFHYQDSNKVIKPQKAVERLYHLTKNQDAYITTEVGQHQMWAAQYYHFDQPRRFMTSGGLGTMGYGLPAAIGVQAAHPEALVIDIAGEASIQMCIQELSTAVQYQLPVKIFILNNQWMGMVRQWQQLLHGERYSHSYSHSLPDFVKLAEAYGLLGLRCSDPEQLDNTIEKMLAHDGAVLVDCIVEKNENCLPMIPSGAAHNEMILPNSPKPKIATAGQTLV